MRASCRGFSRWQEPWRARRQEYRAGLGAVRLSGENNRMLWIPAGFAHGFVVLSDTAQLLYKATDFYAPQHDRSLLWNDPAVGIEWPYQGEPILSDKDKAGKPLSEAETFA